MSRYISRLSSEVWTIRGWDPVLGKFVQIIDDRCSRDPRDMEYVLDWDEALGFSTNRVGARESDLDNDVKLLELTDKYAASFKNPK